MSDLTLAKTILSQLGGNRFIIMTGAKKLVGNESGLAFRIGRNKTRINHVLIRYNHGKDLYEMTFTYVFKTGFKELAKYDDVYAEDLVRLFEETTGLATKL